MRDDSDMTSVLGDRRPSPGAVIIPFPGRTASRPLPAAAHVATASSPAPLQSLLSVISTAIDASTQPHAPSLLAAAGAVAGFAAQQALVMEGGATWIQPQRAEHLDRLLLSESRADRSLWHTLCVTAHDLGTQHLPEPQKLLASTLKCLGTSQFGVITLPLEYRLKEQPQAALIRHWPRVRDVLERSRITPAHWPELTAAMCARRITLDHRQVPPHVALRIIMQSALAMALIEPRLIPGATLKSE